MNRRRFVKLLGAGFTSLLSKSIAQDESENIFTLFLEPDGDDTNNGLSLETSIATLSRAHEIIAEECKTKPREVELRIGPGKYLGQTVEWMFTMPDHTIRFRPHLDTEPPTFIGQGGIWFTLLHDKGQKTNLHFENLHIQNYQTAISLNGNRNSQQAFNSHNTITGCSFKDIGDVSFPGEVRSSACIRLFNSRDNLIRQNHFVNIINQDGPAYIHAVYLAHYARHNIIESNHFKNNSGDPIRVRDFSNFNVVSNNVFEQSGDLAAYSEWYCHQDREYTCTKVEQTGIYECPSWGNKFKNNKIGKSFAGLEMNPGWILYESEAHADCKHPNLHLVRLETSGNVVLQ